MVSNVRSAFSTLEPNLPFEHDEPRRRVGIEPTFVFGAGGLLHHERHGVSIVDDWLPPARLPLILRFQIRKSSDRLHGRLVRRPFDRFGVVENLFLFLGGGRRWLKGQQQEQQNSHVAPPGRAKALSYAICGRTNRRTDEPTNLRTRKHYHSNERWVRSDGRRRSNLIQLPAVLIDTEDGYVRTILVRDQHQCSRRIDREIARPPDVAGLVANQRHATIISRDDK